MKKNICEENDAREETLMMRRKFKERNDENGDEESDTRKEKLMMRGN